MLEHIYIFNVKNNIHFVPAKNLVDYIKNSDCIYKRISILPVHFIMSSEYTSIIVLVGYTLYYLNTILTLNWSTF